MALRADVTVRYEVDIQRAANLPTPAGADPLDLLKHPTVIRVKGDLSASSVGKVMAITDLAKQQVTLLDPDTKTFATIPASQYAEQMISAMPEARQAMAQIKATVDSNELTGPTETIQGLRAEKRRLTISMTINLPQGARQTPQVPQTKAVMEFWTASPEEIERVPALAELRRFNQSAAGQASFANAMRGLLALQSDSLVSVMDQIPKGSLMLRTRMMSYVSTVSADTPLITMTQELKEVSTAPIADSVFQVPPDYRSASAAEVFKALIPTPTVR